MVQVDARALNTYASRARNEFHKRVSVGRAVTGIVSPFMKEVVIMIRPTGKHIKAGHSSPEFPFIV
jgi:hypothetical protein